jgi:hypothetical protein
MELTPEEKQRVEEEEKKRLAEEEYRYRVRAQLQQTNEHLRVADFEARNETRGFRWLFVVVCLIVVGGILWTVFSSRLDSSKPKAVGWFGPKLRYVPVTEKVEAGRIEVMAGGYVLYKIHVTPEMSPAQVIGNFTVSGDTGNEIFAALAKEDEFENWIKGRRAKVYYSTGENKKTDSFDIRLGPGDYVLVISNHFAEDSNKDVLLEVYLKYMKREDVYE